MPLGLQGTRSNWDLPKLRPRLRGYMGIIYGYAGMRVLSEDLLRHLGSSSESQGVNLFMFFKATLQFFCGFADPQP